MAYENIDIKDGKEKIVLYGVRKIEYITIDRDTGNFMFRRSVSKIKPGIELFVFLINGVVIELDFATHYEKELDVKVYTLEKYHIDGKLDDEYVLGELKKAIDVFGYNGLPKEIYNNEYKNSHEGGNEKVRLDISRFE